MEKETHKQLWEAINEIKDNHLFHLQNEVTEIKTNVSWLMKFQWLILSTAIASLLVNLYR